MHSYLTAGAAVFLCIAPAYGAPRHAKPVRVVQLISMSGPGSAPTSPATKVPAERSAGEGKTLPVETDPAALRTAPPGFRVHDLSRRWVEFQMANSFAGGLSKEPKFQNADAGDPFASVGVAQIEPAPTSAYEMQPVSSVPIPAWMRSGLAFSAGASSFTPECDPVAYRPTGFLAATTEDRRAGYYGMMSNIACQYGIPVGLFDAMIIRESGYQANIFSTKRAFGLTQLMPATATGLGVNRYDIEDNLRGGAKYLRQQIDRFGQVHLALAAYNAGPGRVRNRMVPRIAETQAYVDNVLLNWRRLVGFDREPATRAPAPPVVRSAAGIGAGGRLVDVVVF